MGKGILMEVEGRSGVVLTPKGEFRRVPLPKGASVVGDEIEFRETAGLHLNWVAVAAAVLLMALSPFGYQQWSLAQPAALVLIDINPSIQLTLNGRQQVIAAEGLNEDGQMVITGLKVGRRPIDEVTREITARAVAAGKLDPAAETSAVVVAVAPAGKKELEGETATEIAARSKIAVQSEVKAQAEAKGAAPLTQVAAMEATREELVEAKEQGITLPKLIILQEIQESHPEVTSEAIKNQGPGKFVHSLGLNPSQIFSQAEAKHNKESDEVEPASTSTPNKGKPIDIGKPENPGRAEEKGNGNGKGNDKDDDKDDKDDKAADPKAIGNGQKEDATGKQQTPGSGKSEEKKPDSSGKGSKEQEESKTNSGQGGQEKGDSRANEGKGQNKP